MIENDLQEFNNDIAIIGMAGRFPGAQNIDEFWKNLVNGVESIKKLTNQENDNKYKIRASGFLDNIDLFDREYFGFTPGESEIMDPQQRLLLECAVETLDDAAYIPEEFNGRIGVFIGSAISTYLLFNLLTRKDLLETYGMIQISNGNDAIATSLSYKLNLTGPSIDVNTTCSTSLVAVHQACRSLLSYESDMALAGGASINVMQDQGYIYQEGGILSPDGHCRPFDAAAKGTVEGSGLGLVLLKRLQEAITDGDNIHAVIKASAINNDGSSKIGYTAPSVQGQTKVISEAIELANIKADSISYIEAHGTGTVLGDPIEVVALTNAFRYSTKKVKFCAIGSVKSNIGHLNTASGIAGLIKTVLALKHKKIPSSLHFENPNPKIQFEHSPFYVNATLKEWDDSIFPRLAGVSSFGMGGTNAHVIVEEAIVSKSQVSSRQTHLLLLSAKSLLSLKNILSALIYYLANNAYINLADLAYTLQIGRKKYAFKKWVIVESVNEAIDKLNALYQEISDTHDYDHKQKKLIYMFPGQGSQYINMAKEIYHQDFTFKKSVDDCCDILLARIGVDLRFIIFPNNENRDEATRQLQKTAMTQTALFVIEYALAKMLLNLGLKPYAMIGHSLGEYVAACIAGVFTIEDALKIIVKRGELMQSMPEGKMLSVNLSENELMHYLDNRYSIASINTRDHVVVSGDANAIDMLQQRLLSKHIDVKLLVTSHAFHSTMMEPMLDAFRQFMNKIALHTPNIPYISNLTGKWIRDEDATNVDYWVSHLRNTVRFSDGIATILEEIKDDAILLEVGPGQSLSSLVKYTSKMNAKNVISVLPHSKQNISSMYTLLDCIGALWNKGSEVLWREIYSNEARLRLSLPPYVFDRLSYWIERGQDTQISSPVSKYTDINKWFYGITWKRDVSPQKSPISNDDYYLIINDSELDIQNKPNILTFNSKDRKSHINETYQLDLDSVDNIHHMVSKSIVDTSKSVNIVYIQNEILNSHHMAENLQLVYFRIFNFIQALIRSKISHQIKLAIVTNQAHKVIGNEKAIPEKSIFLGLIKALCQEYNHITFCNIDMEVYNNDLVSIAFDELADGLKHKVIAYRNSYRWLQDYEQIHLPNVHKNISLLKQNGTYIITGGLGSLGLLMAETLSYTYHTNIILVSRSVFPLELNWDAWIDENSDNDVISKKILKLKMIKTTAKQLLIMHADVSDIEQMKNVFEVAETKFGNINGIIHAAGDVETLSYKTLDTIDVQDCHRQFKAKIIGLNVIEKLLINRKLDFCCLFSSISSVLSGLGYAAYSSANLYMDNYAQIYQTINNKTPLISISWDAWIHGEEQNVMVDATSNLLKNAIKPAEGCDALLRILNSALNGQLIVSTTDLATRLDQWVNAGRKLNVSPTLSPTIRKANMTYIAPRDSLEADIASIWEHLLGLQSIGVHDNFFALGGHSLMATQLISRIRDQFNIEFSLQLLFDNPTIEMLAKIVIEKKLEALNNLDLDQLFSELKE